MTRLEYELIRAELPHLKLPHWYWLEGRDQERLEHYDRDKLITNRAAILLSADWIDADGHAHRNPRPLSFVP